MRRRDIAAIACALLAAGCMVGPDYHKPKAPLPPAYPGAPRAGAADPAALESWWTLFHDDELDSLIGRALRNNRDIKAAVSRLRQARAEREVAAGALLPELDATAGLNRALGSRNVQLPLSSLAGSGGGQSGSGSKAPSAQGGPQPAAATASAPAPVPAAPLGGPQSPFGDGGLPGVTTNLYQAGFDAVWEIDVFGGQRRAVEAAQAEVAAAADAGYGTRISLLAEVAASYLQVRMAQERGDVARRSIEAQKGLLRIAREQFDAGLGDEVAVAQDAAQLSLDETQLAPLQLSARLSEHVLALLLAEDPASVEAELSRRAALPVLPADLPVDVPSDLLRRRPDVRQAERQLAAANAQIGVAAAQLYPQFSITGLLGIDSSDLKHLPEWSSRYYSLAPGISWPILDWSRLHAAVRVQNEMEEQALLAYQTSVAQALKDVEDALVQYEEDRSRHAGLADAVAQARRAFQVTRQIHEQGLADQTATLVAQRAVDQAEDGLAQSEVGLRLDLVALYKALGGGWRALP
ncbi:MAG TPA: efflux transporter outer membrane subunit [Opitutaceae bacterium]|jgi:NodT family efflux transporter outer membrane factor (OMF) lipoprotein